MGLFDDANFDKADPNKGNSGKYVEPGLHKFKVLRHKYLEESDAFVAEFETLASQGVDGGQPPHAVGSIVSYFVGNKVKGMAEANRAEIKRYVAAVLGVPPDQVTAKVANGTTTEEGQDLIVGKIVECEAWQNKGGTYTKKTFTSA